MSGVFLNIPSLNMPYVRYATEVEYLRRVRETLRTDISSENELADLSRCCLTHPFSSFHLIQEVETLGRDLDCKVRQIVKGLLVCWHNIELFAIQKAR